MEKWQLVSQKTVFKNPHLEILEEECLRGAQKLSPYYTVKKPDAAVICAITKDNNILLIKQYRHPVRSIDIELPAGYLVEGENPEQGVKRELLEETGYSVSDLKKIGEAFSSAGLNSNKVHFYIGLNAIKTAAQKLDEHEDIEVLEVNITSALQMLDQGKIKDMGSLLGLMLAQQELDLKNSNHSTNDSSI